MGQDSVDMEFLMFALCCFLVVGFLFGAFLFLQLVILFILISCPFSHLELDLVSPEVKGLPPGR